MIELDYIESARSVLIHNAGMPEAIVFSREYVEEIWDEMHRPLTPAEMDEAIKEYHSHLPRLTDSDYRELGFDPGMDHQRENEELKDIQLYNIMQSEY